MEAWAEVLSDIPIDRLNECYVLAMKRKESNFALGAPELVKAWSELSEVVRYENLTDDKDDCTHCDDERMEEIFIPSKGETYKLPCFYCRSRAHTSAKIELVKKLGDYDPRREAELVAGQPLPIRSM